MGFDGLFGSRLYTCHPYGVQLFFVTVSVDMSPLRGSTWRCAVTCPDITCKELWPEYPVIDQIIGLRFANPVRDGMFMVQLARSDRRDWIPDMSPLRGSIIFCNRFCRYVTPTGFEGLFGSRLYACQPYGVQWSFGVPAFDIPPLRGSNRSFISVCTDVAPR